MTQLLIAGDWHGDPNHAGRILQIARSRGIKTIFQVGDFGYFPEGSHGYVEKLNSILHKWGMRVVFLDGNHEDHSALEALEPKTGRSREGFWIAKSNIHYAPRGLRWRWGDCVFLAIGGAHSIDKKWRLEQEQSARQVGKHVRYWWPHELITDEDVQRALTCDDPDLDDVHIVLSHDMPLGGEDGFNLWKNDPEDADNRRRIKQILMALKPDLLIHGHYHVHADRIWRTPDDSRHRVRLIGLDCNFCRRVTDTYTIIELGEEKT